MKVIIISRNDGNDVGSYLFFALLILAKNSRNKKRVRRNTT
jgi:hypothetical protein